MPTKLSPSQFHQLKARYKVGPSNFNKYFTRQGNAIYAKDAASANPASIGPDYRALYGLPGLEQKAAQTQTDYTNAAGGQQAFIDALKKALLGQDTQTQGLQAEQQRLQQAKYTQPTSERERLIAAGITDPFERQKLIAQTLGTTDSALSAVSSRLANLGKTREDLIQQGLTGYQTDLALKKESSAAASEALKQAMGLMAEAKKQDAAAKQKQAEANLARRQKLQDAAQAQRYKLDLEKFKAGLKGSSGGSSGGGIIIGGGGTSGTGDPTVDSFANLISSGQMTFSSVPAKYKTAVANALAQTQAVNTAPTLTAFLSFKPEFQGLNEGQIQRLLQGNPQGIPPQNLQKITPSLLQQYKNEYQTQSDKIKGNYAPGVNPVVDHWAKLIISGQSKLSEVPNPKGSTMRSDVANAIASSGDILLSDKDREKLSVLQNAKNIVQELKNLHQGLAPSTALTRIGKAPLTSLGAITQFNDQAKAYNDARTGFVSNIARTLGEKGTLAEGDIQRAVNNIPHLNDTKAVSDRKWKILDEIFKKAGESIISTSTEPLSQLNTQSMNQSDNDPLGLFK